MSESLGESDYVVGVDGCRGGWVAVTLRGSSWSARVHTSFAELIDAYPDARRIAVDIPIGLATGVRRGADAGAKSMLPGKKSSVFWSPDRRVLDYPSMAESNAFLLSLGLPRMNIQTWCILPKIREVNLIMTSEHQRQIIEVHPEVSFAALAGKPIRSKKGKMPGYAERSTILRAELGIELPDRDTAFTVARPAKPDDLLDAIVAAWTARRDVDRKSVRLPAIQETSEIGLRMEIVY